jgi:hypothetical protein
MTPAAIRAKRYRLARAPRQCVLCGRSRRRGSSSAAAWDKRWCLCCEIEQLFTKGTNHGRQSPLQADREARRREA